MVNDRPTLRQGIRTLPRPVWILCAGSFVNRFGSFVAVFLVLYLRSEGYSIATAGLVVSFYGVGNVAAAGIGGWVADRLGRKNAIALSMFSSAATLMLLSQARWLTLIVFLTALAGLTGEMYRPASTALLTDLTPAGDRNPGLRAEPPRDQRRIRRRPRDRWLSSRGVVLPRLPRRRPDLGGIRGDCTSCAPRRSSRSAWRRTARRGDQDDRPRPRVSAVPRLLGSRRLRVLPGSDDL